MSTGNRVLETSITLLSPMRSLDYLVGVSGQFFQQVIWRNIWVDAYPMLVRFVIWIADTVMLCSQFFNAFWLALQRDDREIIAVKEREHVAMNVEHQHPLSAFELLERQFLFYVFA